MSFFHLISHPVRQWGLDAGPHTDEAKISHSAAASPHQQHFLVLDPGIPSFRQKASLSFISPSRTFHSSVTETPILNPGAVTVKGLNEQAVDQGPAASAGSPGGFRPLEELVTFGSYFMSSRGKCKNKKEN